jgi:hypothetical protein
MGHAALAVLGALALVAIAVALWIWPGAWRWVLTAVVLLAAAGVLAATRQRAG